MSSDEKRLKKLAKQYKKSIKAQERSDLNKKLKSKKPVNKTGLPKED